MEKKQLPILPVKDLVIFPGIYMPIHVGREFSKNAVFESMDHHNGEVLIVKQKDSNNNQPMYLSDFHNIAVVCKIIKFEKNSSNTMTYKLLVQGNKRIKLDNLKLESNTVFGQYTEIPDIKFDINKDAKNKAMYELLVKDFIFIVEKGFVADALIPAKKLDDPISTCYLLLSITKNAEENQKFLESNEASDIFKAAYDEVLKQKNFIETKENIVEQTRESMNKSQKEYFLKEQIKAIKKELGEDSESDLESYTKKFADLKSHISESNADEIKKNLKKIKNAASESYEISVIKNYLDYVFDLPWTNYSEENLDIKNAEEVLGKRHAFLNEVKERILEFLSVRKLNKSSKAPIICFAGPPGVGKTSFAQSIAESIGRKSVRIALGGVRDESEIRGHRKTYVGSMPGKIIQGIRQAGTSNPVFILDEIDKMASDFRGDPSAALLEVLDPEQNNTFRDHYLNLEYDLSKVMFIATANNLDQIPAPLMDRLEIIKVAGYVDEEKVEIAKKFLIPKKVKEGGLGDKEVSFSPQVIKEIIHGYTREFGVRELERQIFKVIRKIAKIKAADGLKKPITISSENLKDYLGIPKYSSVEDNKNGVGVVTGLAWTSYGGEILKLESALIEEDGPNIFTGRLGEVMQESAKIGISVIKQNASKWGISKELITKNKIHVHFPAGATPKDGPSAGIAMVTSIVSLLTGKKVPDSLAMTGEVTLTGKVWPIGGVKEKVLAAIRSNIKKVLLPIDNKKDFEAIPKELTKKITPIYVSDVNEVVENVFGSLGPKTIFLRDKKDTTKLDKKVKNDKISKKKVRRKNKEMVYE
jgi:ATP-dependent Lon protease